MVTHGAGLGDQGYNDLANAGGKRAATDFGISWQVIESRSPADYVPNLEAGAVQGELTIGVGFLLTEAVADVVLRYPEEWFHLVDSVVEAPNVASVLFKEQEAAFLAGIVAGTKTRTGRLGVVGGQSVPPVERAEIGFRAGVATVEPAVSISVAYADSFEDPATGKELALAQFGAGADIVFAIAGKTGLGVYEAAAEQATGSWVIGSDMSLDQPAPASQLCAVRKGIDTVVSVTIERLAERRFAPGSQELGLAAGGVALETPGNRVDTSLLMLTEDYTKRIVEGSIVVPSTEDQCANWKPPATPIIEKDYVAPELVTA